MIHAAAADAADAEEIDTNQNNDFNTDEDEKLFLATGYRYSLAHERGFPYPWCAKKHGRKGWLVRNCPPDTYVGVDAAHSTTKSVEFKGWKEAERILHSRQILMSRFGLHEMPLTSNRGGAVATESNENAAQRAIIDHWFQHTPIVMKNQRTANQEAVDLAIEQKRKQDEVVLRKKQREELRELKAKEKIERKKQKRIERQSQCRQDVVVESANNNDAASNSVSGAPASPSRQMPSQQTTIPCQSRLTKRKGNPKRGNKYRDIERSFIENQSLLPSPAKRSHDSNSLLAPSTPTKRTKTNDASNPLPYSPTKRKYKRTQPRKNQQYNNSQSSSIILGEDPLMDQMIEDIVKEFTTEGPSAQGHIFDGGAVSALREAAMDMVAHSHLGEKTELAPAGSFNTHTTSSPQPQIDLDDARMEMMIEQLIGDVATDSGINFDGDAVEALKMAAREIVTDNDGDGAPVTTQDEFRNELSALNNREEKTTEEVEGTSPTNASYHDIQPLQLDNEDSNMSEIGGMITQLVEDLGKESDVQFDPSAVEALKRASRLV